MPALIPKGKQILNNPSSNSGQTGTTPDHIDRESSFLHTQLRPSPQGAEFEVRKLNTDVCDTRQHRQFPEFSWNSNIPSEETSPCFVNRRGNFSEQRGRKPLSKLPGSLGCSKGGFVSVFPFVQYWSYFATASEETSRVLLICTKMRSIGNSCSLEMVTLHVGFGWIETETQRPGIDLRQRQTKHSSRTKFDLLSVFFLFFCRSCSS